RRPLWQRGPTDAERLAGGFFPSGTSLRGYSDRHLGPAPDSQDTTRQRPLREKTLQNQLHRQRAGDGAAAGCKGELLAADVLGLRQILQANTTVPSHGELPGGEQGLVHSGLRPGAAPPTHVPSRVPLAQRKLYSAPSVPGRAEEFPPPAGTVPAPVRRL